MRGLTLRVTNLTSAPLTITDVTGLATFGPREIRDILYTDEVMASLEYGRLGVLLVAGSMTAQFISGTYLSQAPIGRTFTGATPTVAGERGLVPTAPVANRGAYLKGDGTWSDVVPTGIGAVPESKLTTQGDLLVRGLTTSERLPLGTIGQILRAGVVQPNWLDGALSGILIDRPSPGPIYAGVLYWATDQPVGSQLSVCYSTGTGYGWFTFGSGGGGGNTNTFAVEFDFTSSSPLVVGLVTAGDYVIRSLVKVGTPWNGTHPTVTFGTTGAPTSLLITTDVNLARSAQYESGEILKFTAGDNLILTITPDGATAGTGTLLFTHVS
jgi:hypothetical protein